ncbi:STAS domain-containing protein [Streptomyces sp. NPDC094437]|uniref:STAS domain-containing protein n=1 Tax=Streptomyces sp. NPDC094437 TaxID=3366060 RepID=UPI003821336A
MSENHTRSAPRHTVRTVDGTTVVTLRGEIDLAAADPLVPRLDALTSGPQPDLVIDLRPVSFMDCAGLRVLCRTRNRVLARGGRLRLVTDGKNVVRLLRATGLGRAFEVLSGLPPRGPNGPLPGRETVPTGPPALPVRPL